MNDLEEIYHALGGRHTNNLEKHVDNIVTNYQLHLKQENKTLVARNGQ